MRILLRSLSSALTVAPSCFFWPAGPTVLSLLGPASAQPSSVIQRFFFLPLLAFSTARAVLNANKGKKKNLWITELGWADAGPKSDKTVGPAGQKKQLGATVKALDKLRNKMRIRGYVYYGWKDAA